MKYQSLKSGIHNNLAVQKDERLSKLKFFPKFSWNIKHSDGNDMKMEMEIEIGKKIIYKNQVPR